jgi:SAM-dependent methyltransferase
MYDNRSGNGTAQVQPTTRPLPDARKLNAEFFEKQWASTPRLKQRFQFNLELARKDFVHAVESLGLGWTNRAVLDVGFGNGMLAFLFDKSCRICGTELSPSAIAAATERARRAGYREFSFRIPAKGEPLPFEPHSFDIVVASHVVEHVTEDIEFMRSMLQVTRPGGHLVVLVPLDSLSTGILSEDELINPDHVNFGHYHVRNYNMETFLHRLRALPGECVLHVADGTTWDWKASFHERRKRLAAGAIGGGLDRLIAAMFNVPLSLLPRSVLARLDELLLRRGFRPRQALVVIRKGA